MPLTPKGEKIKSAMQEQYGKERGERVFYASKNKGTIEGVDDAAGAPGAPAAPGALAPGAAFGYGTDDVGAESWGGPGGKSGYRIDTNGESSVGDVGAESWGGPSGRTGYKIDTTTDASDYPVPKRRPDLLGTPAKPSGIKPAERELKSQDQGTLPLTSTSSTASLSSTPSSTTTAASAPLIDSKDEKVPEKDLKTASPSMNNLAGPGNPGLRSSNALPYRGVQVGDSLHNQNVRNRAFWARKR